MKLLLLLVLIYPFHKSFATLGKEASFALDVPTSWQQMKDFYGVPFTYLGPKSSNGIRPTIQVIPTEQKTFLMDTARLKKFDDKHKRAKERWLAKSNGYLISYTSMQKIKHPAGEMYVSQAKYKQGDRGFDTKTYFTFCNQKLLQIKSLSSTAKDSGMKENDTIIQSFRCKS